MASELIWPKVSKPLRFAAATCLLATLLPGSAVTQERAAPAGEKDRVLGFAVTYFSPAMSDSPECPAGLNQNMIALVLEAATPEDRVRLSSDAGKGELRRRAFRTPDGNGSLCVNPDLVAIPVPPLKVVSGSGSVPGLDLDGFSTLKQSRGKSCAHVNFADQQGRPTIDNQIYRINGCIQGRRRGGNAEQTSIAELVNGSYAIVVELVGVDDRKNDADVTVSIFSSPDPTPFTSTAKPLPHGSMTIHPDPRYHATAKARLVNGVLRSDPFNLIINFPVAGQKLEYDIREARLELTLKDDGTAAGLLGGYFPLDAYYKDQITIGNHNFFGDGASDTMGFACPAMHKAIRQYADGLRDPKTGECGGLSFAYTIKAMPAFVIKPRVAASASAEGRQ